MRVTIVLHAKFFGHFFLTWNLSTISKHSHLPPRIGRDGARARRDQARLAPQPKLLTRKTIEHRELLSLCSESISRNWHKIKHNVVLLESLLEEAKESNGTAFEVVESEFTLVLHYWIQRLAPTSQKRAQPLSGKPSRPESLMGNGFLSKSKPWKVTSSKQKV